MYYKITNTKSKIYKKLHALRSKELEIEKENRKAVDEKIGLSYSRFFGNVGQQNFNRTTEYVGFNFTDAEQVDPKVWKIHKEHQETFVPNPRTKEGKEMREFLSNGLKGSRYDLVFDILGFGYVSKFTFPYLEIVGEVIILFIGDNLEPTDIEVIEITKREFEELLKIK